jgi:hypothetical protein
VSQAPSGPFSGTPTKQLTVGRYVLTVGAPAGTLIVPTRRAERGGRAELSEALTAVGAAEQIEEVVEEAGGVAGRVERALELTTALAEGRLDRASVLREADALVGLLARLDREGKHHDALRLARALIALLALLGRWQALVQSLRLALRAARTIGDRASEGWAHHEIGTFSLAGGDKQGAASHLDAALRIRQDLGDETGAQVTASNLAVARIAPPVSWMAIAIAAVVALLIAGTAAGILYARDGDDDGTTTSAATTGATTDTTTPPPPLPTAEIVEGPPGLTNDPTAVFSFTAEGAARFECRLDDLGPESCESPKTYPDLDEVEHFFVVVPKTADGQPGQSDERSWTVDTTAPTTSIDKPVADSSTITVTFVANETATYMCWLDDRPPVTCVSPYTFPDLAAGRGYVIFVRATDEAGNEGEAAKSKATTAKTTTTGTGTGTGTVG